MAHQHRIVAATITAQKVVVVLPAVMNMSRTDLVKVTGRVSSDSGMASLPLSSS